MLESLISTRALVIGGSSGIGETTAAMAANAGTSVTIASCSQNKVDASLVR